MTSLTIDAERLLGRLRALGAVGRDGEGRLSRLAGSDADRAGRDLLASWLEAAGLEVAVDRIGNQFGLWRAGDGSLAPLMVGSHIDTVIDAGIYDGCYGVLAGLEAVQALKEAGRIPERPIVVAAFTGEEGARFPPSMLGSQVFAGAMGVEEGLAARDADGATLGEELARIGYLGPHEPGLPRPHAYVELHIEQGPVLDREGWPIGAVDGVQGVSWQRVTVEGEPNHAGTTPMHMRLDAGLAAARAITWISGRTTASNAPTVATVGYLRLEPNVINVVPSRATFTVDLRDPDEGRLREAEAALRDFLHGLEGEGFRVTVERLGWTAPVRFDEGIVTVIEAACARRSLRARRLTSGAGHDAQIMARLCPSAMIFVPSRDGVSHGPREHTEPGDLVNGANVLLDVLARLANAADGPAPGAEPALGQS